MTKISLKLIQDLRDKTGVGMMDCKKALQEASGDVEKAFELLRKKGAAVAAKRSGKETCEGIVNAYIHPGSKVGVLLEVDCETDFVARTMDIKEFANNVCMHIAAMDPQYVCKEEVDPKFVENEKRIAREALEESGKPANVIDKIIEGKISKICDEVCLLNQPFVKDNTKTIAAVLEELIAKTGESIKIKRFARFEIGA